VKTLTDLYKRYYAVILILAFAAVLAYAFRARYFVDDAFISFRYAQNLADGHGIVWNPGERVEGYSNFLWVILFTAGMRLGVQPEAFTYIIAPLFHLAGLILTYLLAVNILKNRHHALIVLLLVGFNHSIAGFAGSGMETPLQMLEFLIAGYIFCRSLASGWTVKKTLSLSLVLNVALLTRPDAVVLIGCAFAGWYLSHHHKRFVDYVALVIPFLLITLPYLIWKVYYYGALLPNSFTVKVHGLSGLGFGIQHLYLFILYYMLIPFIAMVIWRGRTLYLRNRTIGFLAIFTLVWFAYIVMVGGDFMEFRFMAPVIPFMLIVLLWAVVEFVSDRRIVVALIFALCLGTFNNFHFMSGKFYSYKIERLEALRDHLYAPDENWVGVGKKMKALFGGTDVMLAVGAAGAIPYYSELKCVDFIGLNDKTIPHIAESFTTMAGHRIIAPLEYLVNRRVNLVLQPIYMMLSDKEFYWWLRTATWSDIYKYFLDVDKPVNGLIIDEAHLIAIPIEHGYTLMVWYLNQHETVDRVIREQGFRRIKLVRG